MCPQRSQTKPPLPQVLLLKNWLQLSWFSIAVTKYHNQIQLTKALNWVTSFRGSEARRQNKSVAAGTAESSYL